METSKPRGRRPKMAAGIRALVVILALIINFLPVAPVQIAQGEPVALSGVEGEATALSGVQDDFARFIGVQTAMADGSGNVDTVLGAGCMLDVYNSFGQGGGLNCTANDVSLATAQNITILDDGCAFPGDTVSFTADFEVVVTAGSRQDVGIYFSQDGDPNGDGALTGACSINTPAYAPGPDWLDLDGTSDNTTRSNDFGYCSTDGGTTIASPATPCDGGSPAAGDAQCVAALGAGATCEEFGDGLTSPIQDTCGDISKPAFSPLFPTVSLTVTCVDDDGDGSLDLPYCTSWRQSGANELCLTPLAAYPGAPSKCNCDEGFGIPIPVPGIVSAIDKVTLDANGDPLPGDPTLFDFSLTGPDSDLPSNFQLADADVPYQSPGLDPDQTYNLTEAPEPGWQLVNAECTSDQGNTVNLIASGGDFFVGNGESFSCTLTNQQTVVADPQIAIVKSADPAVARHGDPVTYSYSVTNPGNVPLDTVTVSDDKCSPVTSVDAGGFNVGDGSQDNLLDTTESWSFTCSYNIGAHAEPEDNPIVNTATASGFYDSTEYASTAQASVDLIHPAIAIDKQPDSVTVMANGSADFKLEVTNAGDVPLSNVAVADPQCDAAPAFQGGDDNNDGLLDLTESWTYTCSIADVGTTSFDNVATANADDPNGDPVDEAEDTTPVTVFNAVIAIDKQPDSVTVAANGSASFRLVVTNAGDVPLSNVAVADPQCDAAPAFQGGDDNNDGILDLSETWTYTCSIADVGTADFDNVATANADDPGGDPVPQAEDTTPVDVFYAAIAIDKQPDSLTVVANGSASFTLEVTNAGDAPLSNVTVADVQCDAAPAFQGGDTNDDGLLDLSETWTYACSIADVGTTNFDNVATANGDDPNGDPVDEAEDTTPVTVFNAVIAIDKQPDSVTVAANGSASFTLEVTNAGDVPLSNVAVADAQCDAAPAFLGGDTNNDGLLDLTETWTYTCSIADVGTTSFDNVATANGDDPNGDPVPEAEDTTPVTVFKAAIAIDKQPDSLTVIANGSASFTLEVTNAGDVPLSNVMVADAQCDAAPAFQGGDTNDDGLLDLSETWTYTCSIADVGTTSFDNVATANGDDPNGDPVPEAEDTTPVDVINPAIAIDKGPDNQQVVAGGSVSFDLSVTNAGDVPLSNVVVTDAQCTTGPTFVGGDTNDDGVLDLTEIWAYSCTIDPVGTEDFTNLAQANGDDPNGDPVPEAEDPAPVDVINPAIAIDKQPDSLQVVATGSASFDLVVTNAGDVPLSNVVVTDAQCDAAPVFQGGDDNNDDLLDLSETWIYTCSIADVGIVDFDNVATANGDDPNGDPVPEAEDTSPVDVVNPAIAIDKKTNSLDDGGEILEGATVTWRYEVINAGDVPLSNVQVSDDQGVVPVYVSGDANEDGTLDLDETWIYEATGTAGAGEYANTGTATGDYTDGSGNTVTPEATDDSSYFGGDPAIAIDKTTNGTDGSEILEGESVTWRYEVANAGNVLLENIQVSDDQGVVPVYVSGDDNDDGILDLDETWVYEATGTAQAGTYENTGSASGDYSDDHNNSETAEATDDSSYFGGDPAISIDKTTNGTDSSEILEGESVTWRYEVSNAGNVPLENIQVSDDQGAVPVFVSGDDNNDGILDLTETWVYKATGTAGAGDYANTGTATGDYGDDQGNEVTVEATDYSSYFGGNPAIAIDKTTNGTDGSEILEGESVTWRYEVTNAGNVPLSNVQVSDDQGVVPVYDSGDDNNDGILDLGETWFYEATGTAQADDYANTGTASGDYTDDHENSETTKADDGSSYFGGDPAIAIDKTTNGTDGSEILEGTTVTWRYAVTNAGNVPLSNIQVSDDQGVVPVYDSGDANNDGILDLAETWVYEATGTAQADDYANTGSASGDYTDDHGNSETANNSDDSSYFGGDPAIAIVKTTNGTDNSEILEGTTVTWRYAVTNAGNVPLSNIQVTDDQGVVPQPVLNEFVLAVVNVGDTNLDGMLDLTETWFYEATSTAGTGDYANTGTASGDYTDDHGNSETTKADDGSSYFGGDPAIAIVKTTNGTDGSEILEGTTVTWRYEVSNAGNVPLGNVSVSDSDLGTISGPVSGDDNNDGILDLTETWFYEATGTAGAGDYANIGSASGDYSDDHGNSETANNSDDSSYFGGDPAIAIDKTTNGTDGSEILEGTTVTWRYEVSNAGNVLLGNVSVSDSDLGAISGPVSGDDNNDGILNLTETWVYEATGTAGTGDYANTGTAKGDYTDDHENSETAEAEDDSSYFGGDPAISIVKTFTEDSVIAGGAGSSFTLLVTNEGNVPLSGVLVEDTVDTRLQVSSVSGTLGADDDSDGNAQTVEWFIATLGVGGSATITVDFAVDPSEPEDLEVSNRANVEGTYTDDHNNSETVDDTSTDTIDILTEIELSITKTFYRFDDDGNRVEDGLIEQGTNGFFELTVSNAGPSYARDVSVTDAVNSLLEVIDVAVETPSAAGGETCDAPSQDISCTIPVLEDGESVTIVVEYMAAEFLDPDVGSQYGTQEGDEFKFAFVNGYVLEGSTDGGPVLLTNPDGYAESLTFNGTKNEIVFDPPGDDPAFTMHLSCSDGFIGGWGQAGGPIEGVDVNWQIASWSVLRYRSGGTFFKGCGDVVVPWDVPNTAFADGTDSNSPPEPELVSGTDTVQVIRQLKIEFRSEGALKGKKADVLLFNTGEDALTIEKIEVTWPVSSPKGGSGDLVEVAFGAATIYDTPESTSPVTITGPWLGTVDDRTIDPGQGLKLQFFFQKKVKGKLGDGLYTIVLTLAGGLTTEVTSITF